MQSPGTRLVPKSETCAGMKVITFTGRRAWDVENALATELQGLAEGLGENHLLLDFTNVLFITSAELGTLIRLNREMKAGGGKLTLCNLSPLVFEVFRVTRLESVFEICR